jgi:DNA repair protein RadC
LNPSESDTKITQKIKEAGNLMDIQLLDHLILTMDGGYYSFADNGLL